MPAPSFVSAGAIATDLSGGASTTPTPPTHQADDILIAVSVNQPGATQSASGWTLIGATSTPNVSYWWKRATAGGTAGPTITASSTDQFSIVYVIRGCIKTGTPWEDARLNGFPVTNGISPQTDTTPATDIMTVSGPNRLILTLGGADSNAAWASGNPPAGWTVGNNTYDATGTTAGFWSIWKTASSGPVSSVNVGTLASANNSGVLTLTMLPVPDPLRTQYFLNQAVRRASYF